MSGFKNIKYLSVLRETLRSYFFYNSNGEISILAKIISSFTSVLQNYWGTFTDTLQTLNPLTNQPTFSGWRNNKQIIANCKWQIGQLTNVLNHFFDSTLNRIYIDQSGYLAPFIPDFNGDPNTLTPFIPDFNGSPAITFFVPPYNQNISTGQVLIHVPSPYYTVGTPEYTALVSVLEQIKIIGLQYSIVSI